MRRSGFLIATALGEGATGAALLGAPAVVLQMLLGSGAVTSERELHGRLFGMALILFALGCWAARHRAGRLSQGMLMIALGYDVVAIGLLAYFSLGLNHTGPLLWPAVVVHAFLALWCVICLRGEEPLRHFHPRRQLDAPAGEAGEVKVSVGGQVWQG